MKMRRFCLLLAVMLCVPAVAAAAVTAVGDGALGVSAGNGTIYLQGHGVIYGHFDSGTLMVLKYVPDDGVSVPAVSSAKGKYSRGTGVYSGTDVRFLFSSGTYTIELIGVDMNASAVGKGSIVATGLGTPDDGSFTVNGGKPELISKSPSSDLFGISTNRVP
ncbi:MAG TPA: hypothetical protein VH063_16275 [Gaiellaceae bacterium]|nr:hypothetical protein [Gaiellaceae bacterium]